MLVLNEVMESAIQEDINSCIDSYESFRFNAGAGAGKTYALVESIKHLIRNKAEVLSNNNQKALCITYTNVAANEIKERLGNSDIIIISTIHEALWEIIKIHQSELIEIHREKVELERNQICLELLDTTSTAFGRYAALSDKEKSEFIKFITNNKDIYYQSKELSAVNFRNAINSIEVDKPECLAGLLSNIGHFKKIVGSIFKTTRYNTCLDKLSRGLVKNVTYDSKSNSDRLANMTFSHDTLLEYGSKLVDRFPMLRRILVDKYPYVFIDEYQDTNPQIIDLFSKVHLFSIEKEKAWMVGYFGDTAQNIYDDGVGNRISEIHDGVKIINKKFNRRSHQQVVTTINKIRNDSIKQEPIDPEKNNGSVMFYHFLCKNEVEKKDKSIDFIESFRNELKSMGEDNNNIHCLVLTNKLMATLSNFGEIYRLISESKGIYYTDVNSKFLSSDSNRLHPAILLIYNIIRFRSMIGDPKATCFDVFGPLNGQISFHDLNLAALMLKGIQADTLGSFINQLSKIIQSQEINSNIGKSIINNLGLKSKEISKSGSFSTFFTTNITELVLGSENNNADEDLDKVTELLNTDINQWDLWFDFLNKNTQGNTTFHTYHGTKGDEFENVAIIMGHSFGKQSLKFKKHFEHMQKSEPKQQEALQDSNYRRETENTRNLLYVACSRAIKHLRVLYLDDINDIQEGILETFGAIHKYQDDTLS